MSPAEIGLVSIPQVGGGPAKLRPALLLASLPGPYQNLLLYGISTQLHAQVSGWDELIAQTDNDFTSSGLHQPSLIRLSYLYAAALQEIVGIIGAIDAVRLDRLLLRLANHLHP